MNFALILFLLTLGSGVIVLADRLFFARQRRAAAESELAEFDTETLIGRAAQLVVVHEHKDGQVYANIAACTPDKSGAPLKASGKFTRRKDREAEDGGQRSEDGGQDGGGGYRRAQGAGAAGGTDHGAVKVHVGKYNGIELLDLNPEAVQALVDKWLPTAKANAKPTAADGRLIAALEWWAAARATPEDDLGF